MKRKDHRDGDFNRKINGILELKQKGALQMRDVGVSETWQLGRLRISDENGG